MHLAASVMEPVSCNNSSSSTLRRALSSLIFTLRGHDVPSHSQKCWPSALNLELGLIILPFGLGLQMKRPILNGVLILACLLVFTGCSSLRESHQRAVNEMDQPWPWERPSGGRDAAYAIIVQALIKLISDPKFFCSNSK
jgi:hypothetical protein